MFEKTAFIPSSGWDFWLKTGIALVLLFGLGPVRVALSDDLPITLQSLVVLWAAIAFGPAVGGLAVGLYLVCGLAGLPVFANYTSGPDVLTGATGGYLLGFLTAAVLIGWLARSVGPRDVVRHAGLWLGGHAVIVMMGLPWQLTFSGERLSEARLLLLLLGQSALVKSAAGMLLIIFLHRSLTSREEFYKGRD